MFTVPVAQIRSSDTLLDYALTTSPAPLQVSASAAQPSIGSLTIVVSNPGDDVVLESLGIALPVGDPNAPAGADLTEVGAGISGSISDAAWQVGYPGKTDGVFLVTPKSGKPIVIGDQGLAITLTNIQVGPEPGTAIVTITETGSWEVQSQTQLVDPAPRHAALAVPKFPLGFAAGNLSVTQSVIPNGGSAQLTWFGTQNASTTYTMLWNGNTHDVSSVSSWPSPAITDTTTFILEVAAETSTGPVKLWLSTTQTVSTPSIVAETLQVLGTSSLGGDVAVAGNLAATRIDMAPGGSLVASVATTVAVFDAPLSIPMYPNTQTQYQLPTDSLLYLKVGYQDGSWSQGWNTIVAVADFSGQEVQVIGGTRQFGETIVPLYDCATIPIPANTPVTVTVVEATSQPYTAEIQAQGWFTPMGTLPQGPGGTPEPWPG